MKQPFDIIQLLLTDLGPFSFIVAVLLAWVVFQAAKLIYVSFVGCAKAWSLIKLAIYNPFSLGHAFALLLFGSLIYLNGETVVDGIQYVEQVALNPTGVESDTSYWAESRFEEAMKRYTNEAQFLCIRDSTRALAREIGCSPSDIYLVAYSECGLDPFRVRADGVAAGWIQFTRAGLNGLGRTLDQVKESCAQKDAVELMRLTGLYIRRAAAGRKLETATDFYCAVFAPGKIGAGMDDALYSGFKNPEYYLNSGLDGFFVQNQKVLYLPLRKDGKLTKRDLMAALEYKKAKFLNHGRNTQGR